MIQPFKYLYGPVHSWRLGRSLGIDPLSSDHKICNMDCIYCQLGKTAKLSHARHDYLPTKEIIDEISRLPLHMIDYITFSGRGEPTLAKNLGEMIRQIKKIRKEHIAVITNSSLMHLKEVQEDLYEANFVLAKLDASDQESLQRVDGGGLDFEKMLKGIHEFRRNFKGKFALQIMLMDENLDNISELASIARNLEPDEVQLNTPLRPCAIKPIERIEMEWAKKFFGDMPVVSVWDTQPKNYVPFDEAATVKRHGNYFKTRYSF